MKNIKVLLFSVGVLSSLNAQADQGLALKSILVNSSAPSFTVSLPSNLTTGYQWFLEDYKFYLIHPVHQKYQAPKTNLIGAGGIEQWEFHVQPAAFIVPQVIKIRWVYARPWKMEIAREAVIT